MAGDSAGVEPCLPATVLGCEDTPLIDSRILLSFGYRPENDVCPQASSVVFYDLIDTEVVVLGVMHTSQNSEKWLARRG